MTIDGISRYQRNLAFFRPVDRTLVVTIMAGLTIGTAFTIIAVPVLYATFYEYDGPELFD
jgi:hypothetical protein